MNIIILADKFQKRMKSKGCVGLIKIDKRNIIEHQIRYLIHAFKNPNIVYVHGFDSKRLLAYVSKSSLLNNNLTLIYNEHYDAYNNAYSLSLAKDFLNDDTLVMFGDNFIGHKTLLKFNPSNGSQVFVSPQNKNRLGCVINSNKVEHICFDLDNYLYEMYYLSKPDASLLKTFLEEGQLHNCFVFELINKLINSNRHLKPFVLDSRYSLKTIS